MFKIFEKGNFYPADCLKEQFARCVRAGGAAALFFLVTLVLPLSVTGCGEEEEPVYNPLSVNWTSPEVTAKLADYDDTDGDAVIGKASAIITGGADEQFKETAIGNLIADGILAYARYTSDKDVDFAITNGTSGNKTDLPAGVITRSDVDTSIVSAGNTLFLKTYTGAEIKEIISTFVSSISTGKWNRYCVAIVYSGLSYEIVPNPEPSDTKRPTVENVKLNGSPLDEEKDYIVATGNFIATGNFNKNIHSDGSGIGKDPVDLSSDTIKSAVAKYILAKGTISPVLDGRITGEVPVIE